jgi:hypothetical protein
VVPSDFVFGQLHPDLLRSGILLREIDETIRKLDDGTEAGRLAQRLCGLIFLVRKLPREAVADIGVRATPEMLADLLVSDLSTDGARLRRDVPQALEKLVEDGTLIKLDDEYSLQTRESSEWEREFRNRMTRLNNDLTTLTSRRGSLITAACSDALTGIKLTQGASKQPRKLGIHFGQDEPDAGGSDIPVWVRDGWGEKDTTVVSDARAAGVDCATIYVFVPRASAEDLQKAIVSYEAAKATLDFKGSPTTEEGREARDAMATRMSTAEATRDQIIGDLVDRGKVYQGGGAERPEADLVARVEAAANASLGRLFPQFKDADHQSWHTVINRARNGDEAALSAVDWTGSPEKHPVCSAVLSGVGAGKRGKEIRDTFGSGPYGWPRDAIDAALITLHATGHLRATHKGAVLSQGQLDQAKVSVTDFRSETATINTRDRIKLRKLFQSAGVACKPNEEVARAGEFLARVTEYADQAGGDPPMPERPKTEHLEALRALAGNEQLAEILVQHDTLAGQIDEWTKLAGLAAERKPAWDTLSALLDHARTLPGAQDLSTQTETVSKERRLLEPTDPVPAIRKQAADLLRTALMAAHSAHTRVYEEQMAALVSSEVWQALDAGQQETILKGEGILEIPQMAAGTEAELLRALEETSLPGWKTRTDALLQQFARAALAAAKLLEPKTQQVHLTSGTLRTDEDVKAWLAAKETELLTRLKDGPVVVS